MNARTPRTTRALATVFAGVVSLSALTACATTNSGETFSFHSPGGQVEIFYEEDERAPLKDFSGESLMEPGTEISLSDFNGQIVVLNAWGQWCAPCRAEVDDLEEVQQHLSQPGENGQPTGTVLGINVRDPQPEIARDFVRDNGVTYPSIYDPPFRTAGALGGIPTSVIPTTVILDKQHRPAAVFLREISADDIITVTDRLEAEA